MKQQNKDMQNQPSMIVKSKSHLGEGTALADSDEVTKLDITEARGDVGREVLVALLITVVLGDVVQVVTADNARAVQRDENDECGVWCVCVCVCE